MALRHQKLMQVGAGMMMIESTAVSKSGMITEKICTKNNNNFKKFRDLIRSLKKYKYKIGLQISHAGRKDLRKFHG